MGSKCPATCIRFWNYPRVGSILSELCWGPPLINLYSSASLLGLKVAYENRSSKLMSHVTGTLNNHLESTIANTGDRYLYKSKYYLYL